MRNFWLVPAVCLLASCATLQNLAAGAFTKPTLDFKSATVSDMSLSGATVNLVYTVHNPNGVGLSLASVDYDFQVEGKQVAAGKPPAGLSIPANGSADVTFPAQVKFVDLADVLQTFLTKDVAHYKAAGHLGVDTPIGVVSFPLSKEGQFPVPKVPSVSVQAPHLTDLSFTQATLQIPLTVTNKNGFALPVGGVAGHLIIAGVPVGDISTGGLGSLDSGSTKQVSLPLTVHFTSAAFGLLQALRGGEANVQLQGSLESGGAKVPVSFSKLLSVVH